MKTVFLFCCLCMSFSLFAQDDFVYQDHFRGLPHRNARFAFDLYKQLSTKNNKNLFFSPFSIYSCMASLYAGARGETAKEIQKVFYFSEKKEIQNELFRKYLNRFEYIKSPSLDLRILNNIWVDKNYALLDQYKSLVTNDLHTDVVSIDFKGEPERARRLINLEIAKQSQNIFQELLPSNFVNFHTTLITTNVIYLDAAWARPFDASNTVKGEFFSANETISGVDFMQMNEYLINYYEDEEYKIIELPYDEGDLGMVFVLPKDKSKDAIHSIPLDVDFYKNKTAISMQEAKEVAFSEANDHLFSQKMVDVSIPKFKFSTKLNLKEELLAMGMVQPFGSNADFTGVIDNNQISLGNAVHQAFVEVNENGTKAAAATAMSLSTRGLNHNRTFKADRPFVFLIRDRKNGFILFMGRVMNPNEPVH